MSLPRLKKTGMNPQNKDGPQHKQRVSERSDAAAQRSNVEIPFVENAGVDAA